jgi:pyruvate kinase
MLIDDGRLRLRVTACDDRTATTEVIDGGDLSSRKGVSLPGVVIPVSPLTEKDRRDLEFALALGVDWIALSFVQRPDDLAELRKTVQGRAGVLAKLEKPAAIDRLEEIIDLSDAVMVARGDLGVEMPPEDVPILQKRIVAASRRAGKPVVVATQMLESMVTEATPTRAEATDVANAVYEGADAVMLSAETAAGAHPIEAVAMMDRIIRRVEQAANYRMLLDAALAEPQATAADAITAAARQVAETISAAAIVTYTTSGSTALRAARERPTAPILCLTGSHATARRLVLAWGVESFFTHDAKNVEEMVGHAQTMARDRGFAKRGDSIVITAGMPFGTPGATNMLRIAWVN